MIHIVGNLTKLVERRSAAMSEYGDGLTSEQRDRCKTMNDIEKIAKVRWFSAEDRNQASGAWHALNFASKHADATVVEYGEDGDVLVFAMKPAEAKKLIMSLARDK